jgi:hypothetical protein
MAGLISADLAAMRTHVKNWADRSDLSDSVVDSFINIAVERCNKKLKVPFIEAVATLPITDSAVALPSDYLEARQLTVTIGDVVYPLSRKDLSQVEFTGSQLPNFPLYFARKLQTLVIAPEPASATEAELYYWKEVDSLVADTDTNWYITDAGNAVLYASLKELGVFISDEEYAAGWEGQFITAANEIEQQYNTSEWSGSTLSVLSRT